MSIMDSKGRLFGRISLFDIIIVLLVVIVAAGVYVKFLSGNGGKAAEVSKIRYDIEIKNVGKDFVDAINMRDPIRDSVRGNDLGWVAGKNVVPATKMNTDYINGKFVKSSIAGMYDVTVTIEADATIGAKDIIVGGEDIRVGKKMSIKGKGYANTGFVLSIAMPGK